MIMRIRTATLAMGLCAWSFAAFAGEVNGSQKNPKEDYSKGVSFCKFSGQNDDPTGIDPEANGPPGRVQNFGHEHLLGLQPQDFNPGTGCNPNRNPLPPELLNR